VMLSHFQFPQTDVEPALHLVGIAALRAAVKVRAKIFNKLMNYS